MPDLIENTSCAEAIEHTNPWAAVVANGQMEAIAKSRTSGGNGTTTGIDSKPPIGDPGFGGGRCSDGRVTDPGSTIYLTPLPGFNDSPRRPEQKKGHEL